MASISQLQQVESLRHLDAASAFTLVTALHRHLQAEALIEVLWSHAATLFRATGMAYRHPQHGLEVVFGDGPHTASYQLSHQDETLGELVVHFRRRVDDATLELAEELLGLTMPALRNALTHREACRRAARAEQATGASNAPARSLPGRRALRVGPGPATRAAAAAGASTESAGTASDDALVLVRLDGIDDIRTAHGEAWTQTLVQTLRGQIDEGLRDADRVFQIDEGVLAVLLPRTSEEAAMDVAGKIRVLISGLHLRDGRVASQLTACMGVVGASRARRPEDVLARARSALTSARREGHSTIRAYRP